jgi:hypothetical protein
MEILAIAVVIGLIPAIIAKKKGRSFFVWWVYGALLFIVALPHALLAPARPDNEDVLKQQTMQETTELVALDQASPIDFAADGVIRGVPFHYEPDGGVTAFLNGQTRRFKSMAEFDAMVTVTERGL